MEEHHQKEIILLSSKIQNSSQTYQVQKAGVIYLRRFRNKKFRVIFNVIQTNFSNENQGSRTDIFNAHLIVSDTLKKCSNSREKQVESKQRKRQKQKANYLTISTNSKEISDNRLIVVLNAYLAKDQSPKLLVLGYLISSLVMYHNWSNQFSAESHLTNLLCSFGKLLRKTDIDRLNQSIKFKTGYNKTPYFLCLLSKVQSEHSNNEYQNYMNEFYRFQSQNQNSKINHALEAMIDYFPERSSLGIEVRSSVNQPPLQNLQILKDNLQSQWSFTEVGFKQIDQLGRQFETTILGRQLFNFQFTATTIQNLLFQMCEAFNQNKNINLIDVYNKVILNKKSRLFTESIELYLSMIRDKIFCGKKTDLIDDDFTDILEGNSILPISQCNLNKITQEIRLHTLQETSTEALNCMNLEQYLENEQKILRKIREYEDKLNLLNTKLGDKFLSQSYEILQIDQQELNFQQQCKDSQSFSAEKITQVFEILTNRIESFSSQCIQLFAQGDTNSCSYSQTFLKLVKSYIDMIKTNLNTTLSGVQLSKRKDKLQIATLKYELRKIQTQRNTIRKQYQFQMLMEAQLKTKLQQYVLEDTVISQSSIQKKGDTSIYTNSKEYYKMKMQLQELEEQVQDKNIQLQQLIEILEKFESTSKITATLSFYEKRNDNFNDVTQKLINESNEKILKFYQILEDVKNTQKQYENVKKYLMKERQKIIREIKQNHKLVMESQQLFQKTKVQKSIIQKILQQQKQTIEKMKYLTNTLKQNMAQVETTNAQINCALAQAEGQLQSYRKALKLVIEQYTKGKSQNLHKFYRFLEHPDIKQLLKQVISKY